MKSDNLKEILLNLDLMANKELDERKKRSLILIKHWFKSYSDNLYQDSLLRIWTKQWSSDLEGSYYDFPVPSELNTTGETTSSKIDDLVIYSNSDSYSSKNYELFKVKEALFLKTFKNSFIYLVGHNESYITAVSKKKLDKTDHLVLLKNDTEAILLDGTDLKLEVKAA